jgi:hypothetical protein
MACVTRDSSPIPNRSLTHRRRAVVCWHNHHANTSFSQTADWNSSWTHGSCGFALVLALSQMREHGLGPFGRADLPPRRKPLDRQGRFAPQPGSAGQLAGVAVQSLRSKVQSWERASFRLGLHWRASWVNQCTTELVLLELADALCKPPQREEVPALWHVV